MSATTLNPAAQALISAGDEAREDETNESINAAAVAVGKLFSLVQAGKLEIGTLTQLVSWAEDPNSNAPQQGQPAALGTGAPQAPTDIASALAVLDSDPRFAPFADHLRAITAGTIQLDANGEDIRIADLHQEVRDKDAELSAKDGQVNNLQSRLDNEQDVNVNGSLAQQLAAAQAAAVVPTNMVDKAAVKAALGNVKAAEGNLDTSWLSGDIEGRTELQQAITAAEQLVS